MKIAIDGMGGDNAPCAIVCGIIESLKENNDIEYYVTGPSKVLEDELSKYEYPKDKIHIIDAKEVITTNEQPVMALRKKKDSSIVKALNLVKDQECDAIVSAGSTGAFLAGCTLIIGRIKGVDRPALAPIMPGRNGKFMVVDVGANVDCKPEYLRQFAHMGKIYYELMFDTKNTSIGLVNIGAEEEKGNELTKEVYQILKKEDFNFVGNVEPRDVPTGDVNVLVTDGFVGNTVLKMYEGSASNILGMIKDAIMSSGVTAKAGALLLKPLLKKLMVKFDYKEVGGAPFLGINSVCIKAHGSSDGKAFKNAIRQAKSIYDKKIIDKIKNEITLEK